MLVRIVAALLGLVGIGGAALALFTLMHSSPAAPPQVVASAPPPTPKVRILTAARVIRAGNLLVGEDVASTEVTPGSEPPGSFPDTVAARAAIRGSMIRRSLAAAEPIVAPNVLNPGDRGFLAAVLATGMRAVTVGVDSVSGTAGLIWPGDRIDIVLTQSIDDKDQPAARRIAGETVLANARVVAVDQQLVQGGQAGQQANNTPPANRTVTLEATPFDAERIAVAARLGKFSLTVRSAADDQQAPGAVPLAEMAAQAAPPVTWSGDVSSALRDRRSPGGRNVRVFRGSKEAEEVHF